MKIELRSDFIYISYYKVNPRYKFHVNAPDAGRPLKKRNNEENWKQSSNSSDAEWLSASK